MGLGSREARFIAQSRLSEIRDEGADRDFEAVGVTLLAGAAASSQPGSNTILGS